MGEIVVEVCDTEDGEEIRRFKVHEIEEQNVSQSELEEINEQNVSLAKLPPVGSLYLEAGQPSFNPGHTSKTHSERITPRIALTRKPSENQLNWKETLLLAFQSIGIVYGDIGTSLLYVYASTFPDGIHNNDDVVGVLSLIIYTILLVPLVKYVFVVLWANDNGDGGTFALYSLICRYTNVGFIRNHHLEDREQSNYRLHTPCIEQKHAYKIKLKLEHSKIAQVVLFVVTIIGISMVIGDGVLSPSMSVLSSVGGIGSLGTDAAVGISVAILIVLFSFQRFGTHKVGYFFAPIICLWFTFISGIGLYNLFKYDLGVLRAINPVYIIEYFKRNGKQGWISLGGVVLCITGTEAMFANLGHFNVRAIQISFSGLVLHALATAYSGQAAYLRKHPENVRNTFYNSIPRKLYWPKFVVAVAAAIIASQAMISGAFAIITQSLSLGCFPRVKFVHTSPKYEGQVYIPEINYILMIACILVTIGFKTTENIGYAYGIAVIAVMMITTCMVILIMFVVWKTNLWVISLFCTVFISVESLYLSSVLYKFVKGGYLPLAFSFVMIIVMGVWKYVDTQIHIFESKNNLSTESVKELTRNPHMNRLPGMGLFYSELVEGIPPMFSQFIANIPCLHSVVIFISVKTLPISEVAMEDRFIFWQVEPTQSRMFCCSVRYGYTDKIAEIEEFEQQLVENMKEFILHKHYVDEKSQQQTDIRSTNSSTRIPSQAAKEEMQFVQRAMEEGVVYLIGESEVIAKQDSSLLKKIVVNYAYNFLRKNCRQPEKVLDIPRARLLRVGMTYEI